MGRVDSDRDIDEKYLSYYVEGEIIPNEHRQLGAVLPLVDSISDAIHECDYGCDPTLSVVSMGEPRPYIAPSNDCAIMVLQTAPPDDLWEVDEIVNIGRASPPANLWDVDTVVDVTVGNEVWTVNSALVDGGLWDVLFVTNPSLPFEEAAA
ncbi:hypothetical protein RHMOL_Rhmol11G0053100 [Rhododendron molle]|nr:hypothetical protein RHMOL_Rhmol11G0053100 [Rhododendron molle]